MAELRVGILGGTFNPIHVGHLVFAESFRERLCLDRVLLVPVGVPPHKAPAGVAAAHHRYAMVCLAVAGHPRLMASSVEMTRPGPSYSVDTVATLAEEWVGSRLHFLVGSDTFLELPTWRTPERILTRAALAVGDRPGEPFDPDSPMARAVLRRLGRDAFRRVPPEAPEALDRGDVTLVDTDSLPVSARELRRRVAAGRSVRYHVPPAVADYIVAHRLYREGD